MELTKKDKAYYKAAKEASELSDFNRIHIGTVVVHNHQIISSGCNQTKSHPIQKILNKERYQEDKGHMLHSEVSALLPLLNNKDINWKKVELYIYREYQDARLAPCRPCASCQKLIRELGIRQIHYTMKDSFVSETFV